MTPLLEIRDLDVRYDRRPFLSEVSLEARRGETIALLGCNGAGKSTLLRCIAGIIQPDKGSIQFNGIDLNGLSVRKRIRMGISYVAQGRECFPDLTLKENTEVAMSYQRLGRSQREDRRSQVLSLLPTLKPLLHHPVDRLSGGQQQLLVLAMAMCQRPDLLLLDEPSVSLDHSILAALLDALRKYSAGGGTVLLVEQNLSVPSSLADRALYLENGKIEMEGAASELLGSAALAEKYLGFPVKGQL